MPNPTQSLEACRDVPSYEDLRRAVELSEELSSELPIGRKAKLNMKVQTVARNCLQKIGELKRAYAPQSKLVELAREGVLQIEHLTGEFLQAKGKTDVVFASLLADMDIRSRQIAGVSAQPFQPVPDHTSSSDGVLKKAGWGAAIGELVRRVGHVKGTGVGFLTEMSIHSARHDGLTLKEDVIAGSSEAIFSAGVEYTLGPYGYLAVVGAELVAHPAKTVETRAKESLALLPRKERKGSTFGIDDGYTSVREAMKFTETAARGAQKPKEFIDDTLHGLEKAAKHAFQAVCEAPDIDDGYTTVSEATEITHAVADVAQKSKELIDDALHGLGAAAEQASQAVSNAPDTVLGRYPADEHEKGLTCMDGGCMTPHQNAILFVPKQQSTE
jgi:hypothetical protein